jgi:flagellar capping protein FliD
MRIGGLASGMDIDQMVKELMTAERIPLDKLSQEGTGTSSLGFYPPSFKYRCLSPHTLIN